MAKLCNAMCVRALAAADVPTNLPHVAEQEENDRDNDREKSHDHRQSLLCEHSLPKVGYSAR